MRPLTRRGQRLLGGLGLAAGLGAAAALVWGGYTVPANLLGPTLVLNLAVPWCFLAAGLAAWQRRPDSRIGPLMVIFAFAYLARFVVAIAHPAAFFLGTLVGGVNIAVQVHILLTYPTGRATSWFRRLIVAVPYALSAPRALVLLLAGAVPGPTGPMPPGVLITADPSTSRPLPGEAVTRVIALALSVVIVVMVGRSWRRATPAERRALAPAMWGGAAIVITFVAVVVAATLGLSPETIAVITWFQNAALLGWPAALLYGLLRSRLDRADVGELIIELGAGIAGPDRLRAALASALHDPSLRVALWSPADRSFVGADGNALDVEPPPPGQAVTCLEREGTPVAALLHDAALAAEPELLGAVAASAGLAIENERLHAEVRAQLVEVRASRARIVAAADAARRRVERDLHDGAQQRLVGVALALRLARAHADRSRETAELIDEATAELSGALEELRELARGIYPAALTDGGLTPALRSLTDRSSIPIRLLETPDRRLSPELEQTCYFLVSEALANVAKHARASTATVAVHAQPHKVVVEVDDDGIGGVDPRRGSGMRGMTDRAAAVGGTLTVVSRPGGGTRLLAELPCE